MRIEPILRRHLKSLGEDDRLGAQSNLRSLGLDSMGAIQVILAVEREFGITVDDDDLTEATTATPAAIARLTQRVLDRSSQ